jgi:hypothetical protein
MENYTVQDRVRRLSFQGKLIGKSSTRRSGSLRWTDISIYRTAGGQYIVQREGLSLVYHWENASCARGELISPKELLAEGLDVPPIDQPVACPICDPPQRDVLSALQSNPGQGFRREVTISSADVTSDPQDIPRHLLFKGRLTTVGVEALEEAVRNDPALRGTLNHTEVIQ